MGLIIAILTLLLLTLLISWYTYQICFFSPMNGRGQVHFPEGEQYQKHRERIRSLYRVLRDRPSETVSITSHDGLRLSGRYYHCKDGAPLDIGFHGYRSSPFTDFAGGSEISFLRGHNLLLIDQRAHGSSQGRTITFGLQERKDCLNWIQYALNRFGADVKITLFGVSMGAATVLMASGLSLPKNVKGIVADCPYANAGAIIRKVCADRHYPVKLSYPFIRLGARLFGSFNLEETDAIDAVRRSQVPILIIHGDDDLFVPPQMSEEVAKAHPHIVRREGFPNAGHAISYLEDTERYRRIVNEFQNQILS